MAAEDLVADVLALEPGASLVWWVEVRWSSVLAVGSLPSNE